MEPSHLGPAYLNPRQPPSTFEPRRTQDRRIGHHTAHGATHNSRRALISAVILELLSYFGPSAPLAIADVTDDRGALVSRYASEQQFKVLSDDNTRITVELEQLNRFNVALDGARACLGQYTFDRAASTAATVTLKKALDEVKKVPAVTALGRNIRPWDDLNMAMGSLFRLMGSSFECLQPVGPVYLPPGQSSPQPLIDSIRQIAGGGDVKRDSIPDPLPSMGKLLRSIDYNQTKKRSELAGELFDAAEKEVQSLSVETLENIFRQEKQFQLKVVESMATRSKAEIDSRQSKLTQNTLKLKELDKALAEKQAQQSALDRGLVYAIYGMILALTFLFLGLRFFPESIAVRVIEDRSLVEVMSMAFILLTIIILGTGEKIGKETLGTLLGTIAGYIFGRKMSEDVAKRTGDHDRRDGERAAAGSARSDDRRDSPDAAAQK